MMRTKLKVTKLAPSGDGLHTEMTLRSARAGEDEHGPSDGAHGGRVSLWVDADRALPLGACVYLELSTAPAEPAEELAPVADEADTSPGKAKGHEAKA